jgi:hypothetical protein
MSAPRLRIVGDCSMTSATPPHRSCALMRGHEGEHVAHVDDDLAKAVEERWTVCETRKERWARRGAEVIDIAAPTKLERVDVYTQRGEACRFVAGDRIAWRDPFGIGGVTITATIVGFSADRMGSPRLAFVELKADPCETLRKHVEELNLPSHTLRSLGQFRLRTVPSDGLSGKGGLVVATGDSFRLAVYEGRLELELEDAGADSQLALPGVEAGGPR